MKYFLDFCKNSELLEDDLISCVGYSDEAKVHVDSYSPSAAKNIKKWSPMGLSTEFLIGLEQAYGLAEQH